VVIKVFFAVLVLCTVAVVAVILAVHFRVKRHLQKQKAAPEMEAAGPGISPELAAPRTEIKPSGSAGKNGAGTLSGAADSRRGTSFTPSS
jgi:hypothetical protein